MVEAIEVVVREKVDDDNGLVSPGGKALLNVFSGFMGIRFLVLFLTPGTSLCLFFFSPFSGFQRHECCFYNGV